jgi:ABC-type branched-subunit amino acid transport system substrate-binding protein
MRHHAAAYTLLAMVLAAPACEPRVEVAPPGSTYNIVAVLPLTGKFAAKGRDHRAAIEMAIADLEAAGGVGKPVRLVVVDAGEDSARARELLEEALDSLRDGSDRLHAAAILSSTTAALKGSAPLALELGIPHIEISSGSGLDEVSLPDEADATLALATRPLCMPEPELTAQLLTDKLADPQEASDWQDVVFVRGTDAHDKMHTDHVRMHLEMHGWTGVVRNDPQADDIVIDGDAYATALATVVAMEPQPDVLYYHLNGDQRNIDFLEAARQLGYEGKIVTCGMARNKILLDPVDPGIAGYLSGRIHFMMRGPRRGASYDAFESDFEAFTGRALDTFSPSGYDAAMLVGLALAATGGETGADLRDAILDAGREGEQVTYGDPRAVELARSGADLDYEGASGSLDFYSSTAVTDQGEVIQLGYLVPGRFYVETIEPAPDGEVDPYRYRTMEPDEELP